MAGLSTEARVALPDNVPLTVADSGILNGVRTLVVEDDVDAREILSVYLKQAGANVTLATSADDALSALERDAFDVMVSDIGLPNVDGHMLIQRVRGLLTENAAIAAVAVTAYAHADDRDLALRSGFHLHIAKPIRPTELVLSIAELLSRQQPRRTMSI